MTTEISVHLFGKPPHEMKIYGDVGIVAYDPVEDKVQCHICGKWFRGLNTHVFRTHGWTADEYREEFGLNRGQPLICQGTREILSQLNKKLGNWKHLLSQTMTKQELKEFLSSVQPRGFKLRQQTIIPRSQRLLVYNPMNEPKAIKRRVTTERETWYGTPRMREISRRNLVLTIAKIRERNLEERRWTCPCGQPFPTRDEAYHHRRHCVIARQRKIEKQAKARKGWWLRHPSILKDKGSEELIYATP